MHAIIGENWSHLKYTVQILFNIARCECHTCSDMKAFQDSEWHPLPWDSLPAPAPSTIPSPFCKSCSAYPTISATRSLKQRMKVTLGYSRQLPRLPIGLFSRGKNSKRVEEEATQLTGLHGCTGVCVLALSHSVEQHQRTVCQWKLFSVVAVPIQNIPAVRTPVPVGL